MAGPLKAGLDEPAIEAVEGVNSAKERGVCHEMLLVRISWAHAQRLRATAYR